MMRKKSLRRPLAAAVVLLAAWQIGSRITREQPRPARALLNQVWIERMPRDTRDMVRQFVAFETERRRLGLAAAMSHWRVIADRFTWTMEGDHLRARFPQAERSVDFVVRTWECKGSAPEPFELCLELQAGGKSLRLYSRPDWRVDPEGEVKAELPLPVAPLSAPETPPNDEAVAYPSSSGWPSAWQP